MKSKALFVCMLFTFCIAAQAQVSQSDYRPMVEDGKTWCIQVGWIGENQYENRMTGDTLIDGEIWKKVYNSMWGPKQKDSYYVAMREVGKKVYAIANGSNRTRLLYDFGLKEGQTVRCGIEGNVFYCLLDKDEQPDMLLGFPLEAYLRVEHIDTIRACGDEYQFEHRRFTLTLLDAYREPIRNGNVAMTGNVVWLEGIGSASGPFSPWMPLPFQQSLYLSCKVDKTRIFDYFDYYKCYETDGIISTRHTVNESSVIHSLLGRRLTVEPQQKGVYIRGGRKYVRK